MKSNAKKLEAIRAITVGAQPFNGTIDDLNYWVKSTQELVENIKKIVEAK